jgi:hypothetical protein
MAPMGLADAAVFVTVAGSVLAWAAGEWLRSRVAWSLGAFLAVAHALLAFAVFYGWSHAVAREATARQTAALTGLSFAGGIYVNYVFLLVWLGDAVWWWAAPRSRAARPGWVSATIRGFIFFIIVNGAVVFADGLARLLGIVAVSVVAVTWFRRFKR